MKVKISKRGSRKHMQILGIQKCDAIFVVPMLILNGLSENAAADGYRMVMDGFDFSCVTSKNVSVFCTQKYDSQS